MGQALLLTIAAAVAWGGCRPSTASVERREEQDPLIRRARALRQAGDVDGALALYQKALERHPGLGRAHLEAGLLYDDYKKDYVRAIYHYEAYLALRPEADKAKMVQELIRTARIRFAASLPDRPSEAVAEIAALKKENESLREQLREARAEAERWKKEARESRERAALGASAPAPPVIVTAAAPTVVTASLPPPRPSPPPLPPVSAEAGALDVPPPAPASPAVETYRVQRGDTLSSIAAKMYEDPAQWRRIYEANRATLKSPESLRVGQVLIIPR